MARIVGIIRCIVTPQGTPLRRSGRRCLDSKVSGVYTRPALKREETMTRFALVRSSTLIGVLIVGMMVGSAAATFLAAQQPAAQQPQPPAAQPPAQPAGRGQGAAAEPPAPCGPQAQ